MSFDDEVDRDASKAGIDGAIVYPVGGGADDNNYRIEGFDWTMAGSSGGFTEFPCNPSLSSAAP
jgi:hypothetical protein